MANSFVENLNNLANATTLATGDIVEDTQTARDVALAAASEAKASEVSSAESETLAKAWADKGHNNPVIGSVGGNDAEYSSYHWATEASLTIGDPIINDNIISANYTWSSEKLNTDLNEKSDANHLHGGVYEPVIDKNTAFNKNFSTTSGVNGVSENIAREDHLHTNIYEPKRATSGTAYNKDFGTTSGTVMEGDRRFDADYMPKVAENSAYNKSFVANTLDPQADEINRGNHGHPATKVSYDNSGTTIGSSTSQGAISELSMKMDAVTVAEMSYITGLSQNQYTQVIPAQNTATKVMMPIPTIHTTQNASNNANAEVKIDYVNSSYGRPNKLVEGTYTVVVTLSNTEEFALNVAIDDVLYGEASKGKGTITITHYVTQLDVTGINGENTKHLSFWLTNLDNDNDAVIESANFVWAGSPAGALVASGTTINHADLIGTGATNGVHTTSDIQGLDSELGNKANLVTPAVLDNFIVQDSLGDLKDSGIALTTVDAKMDKLAAGTTDYIIIRDASGNAKDSGTYISDLALKEGTDTQLFSAASGTTGKEVVNYEQLDAVNTVATGKIAKVSTPTVGSFPQLDASGELVDSQYDETSFATAVHAHTQSDVTGLQDELNNKYTKTIAPVTENMPMFNAANELVDSGISAVSLGKTADKVLASKNITDMTYDETGLSKITYEGTGNFEDLTYSSDGLSNIAHTLNDTLSGNTVLSYSDGDLVSVIFTEV